MTTEEFNDAFEQLFHLVDQQYYNITDACKIIELPINRKQLYQRMDPPQKTRLSRAVAKQAGMTKRMKYRMRLSSQDIVICLETIEHDESNRANISNHTHEE